MGRLLKTGSGWRVGWNPTASEFKGLVGAEDWAVELTEAEFNDFCRLAEQLSQTLQQIANELMDEEKIACELESSLVWLEVEGYPTSYTLRLIVLSGRRAEGFWSATAAPELLQAIQTLSVF
ncbi:MAG: DUF1818 family protein [Myxacorys californica WJT36-NPBG1]|jgi:hypothetical protein|nr:DUF1818 family protein [Myxacorys californica WJT36-NPBG1]